MTKFPEPGKVKTRLAASIGNDAACELHRAMVQHLLEKTLPQLNELVIRFHVAGGDEQSVSAWLSPHVWQIQHGENLGEKMQHAIQASLCEGAEKVIIIGTDAPAISNGHINAVNDALDADEVVFTPALDGGYVMAGMKRIHAEMFENIRWSTEEVLSLSVERLEAEGVSVKLLDSLRDIDTEQDLDHATEILGAKPWGL
ncbi:TIGR04282 family arsenosugar biosynthesis glycosyltransferase [Rubritalea sp.]|uniref:TIGR04282 family arsenosugar biosynthesis glycosyltransferase n=1 Tax=Rubritalea sp. TaxID=2109375 RepID=UPI003EF60C09